MNFSKITNLTLASALVFVAGPAGADNHEEWALDAAHADVAFSVTHLAISEVTGKFKAVSGSMHFDEANIAESSVEVTVDLSSVDTGQAKRDGHLQSADFFNVEKNPSMTFKSTKVKRAGKGKLKVTGDLTLHGVTKSVVLDVVGPSQATKNPFSGNTHRAFTATGTIDRRDFGLTWNKALESGGVVVGHEVRIRISAEFVKPTGEA
ncbi:MAG: YceI family protein [Myxococcota bacterium]